MESDLNVFCISTFPQRVQNVLAFSLSHLFTNSVVVVVKEAPRSVLYLVSNTHFLATTRLLPYSYDYVIANQIKSEFLSEKSLLQRQSTKTTS